MTTTPAPVTRDTIRAIATLLGYPDGHDVRDIHITAIPAQVHVTTLNRDTHGNHTLTLDTDPDTGLEAFDLAHTTHTHEVIA